MFCVALGNANVDASAVVPGFFILGEGPDVERTRSCD